MQITPLTKHLPSEWLPDVKLTNREDDVANLLLAGLSKQDAADVLGVSRDQVTAVSTRVFKKFNVSNQIKLLALAIESLMPVDYDLS